MEYFKKQGLFLTLTWEDEDPVMLRLLYEKLAPYQAVTRKKKSMVLSERVGDKYGMQETINWRTLRNSIRWISLCIPSIILYILFSNIYQCRENGSLQPPPSHSQDKFGSDKVKGATLPSNNIETQYIATYGFMVMALFVTWADCMTWCLR